MKAAVKKAMVGELTIVIGVVLLVVLIIFVGKLNAGFKGQGTDRDICKSSVSTQASVMEVPFGKGLIPTNCKTYNVVFYDNHVEINGKVQSVYDSRENQVVTRFDSLTNDIVNHVVAEELRGCWYQYLEGKKFILDRKSLLAIFETGQPRLCVLCDEISFDSSVPDSTFTGFYSYTKTHEVKDRSYTYYSYYAEGPTICTDYSSKPDFVNCWESYFADQVKSENPSFTPENTPTFRVGEKYAVVFIMRGVKPGKKELFSESDVDFFSYVLPADKLSGQCDTMQRGSVS